MLWYFVRKYIALTLVVSTAIAVVWWLSPMPKGNNLVFKSIFWGSLIATYLTYQLFRRDNLWVLYSNLRIPGYLLLGILLSSVQLVNVILLWVVLQ